MPPSARWRPWRNTNHVDVVGARTAGLEPLLVDEANLYADADCRRIASIAELSELVRGR